MDKKTKSNPSDDGELAIIYDAECPVCTAYSCSVEIDDRQAPRASGGSTRARPTTRWFGRPRQPGLDLDEGMVVVHQGQLYHGADALNIMARLAPRQGLGNRLNRLMFGNRTLQPPGLSAAAWRPEHIAETARPDQDPRH